MVSDAYALTESQVSVIGRDTEDLHETWADKARREVELFKQGASGFSEKAGQKLSKEELPATAAEFVISTAAGVGLAYLTRGKGPISLAAKTVGIAGLGALAKEGLTNGFRAVGAVTDTWESGANFDKNAATMKESVGSFGFDMALMSASGLAGSAAGYRMFKPKIPDKLFDQFDFKTGIRQDYYNAFNAAEMKTNFLLMPEKASPKMVEMAKQSLPEHLGRVRNYTKYWTDEIAAYEKASGTTLDAKGIQNFFVNGRSRARELDRVADDIRGFATRDLNDPVVLNQLVDKFQLGRRLIYGDDANQTRRLVLGS